METMSEIVYRLIDALHGAVVVLLVGYAVRLLLVRREGAIRVRHLAGAMVGITALQTLMLFLLEEEERIRPELLAPISLVCDLMMLLAGIGMIWILIRNRQLYERRLIATICGLLGAQWLCYGLCAAVQFADWTSLIYIPVSGMMWGTIGYLTDHAKSKATAPMAVVEEQQENPFLEELNRVLSEDRYFCREELTRDEVCRKMLTNRTTFSARLSKASGMTFSEYLREMRLREAARLLRETDMSIDQVAFDVGLRSASGFHRNFLLSYGMTPRQYRKSAQTVEC